jgi:hypothetical protein
MSKLPKVGSSWYQAGEHWTILGHTVRDGLPAVSIGLDRKPRFRKTVVGHVFMRTAVSSGE